MIKVPFRNTYARLPEDFYSQTDPTPVKSPSLFKFNHELAKELGIPSDIENGEAAEYFSGNKLFRCANKINNPDFPESKPTESPL